MLTTIRADKATSWEDVYKRRLIRPPAQKPKTGKEMYNDLLRVAEQHGATSESTSYTMTKKEVTRALILFQLSANGQFISV